MKTFKEFQQETNKLNEVAPIVAAGGALAMKGIGAGLAAYSALDAVKQFRKGNYGKSAFSALGAIPGAGIFKGAKFLTKSNKIAKGARSLSSVNKFLGPDGRNFAIDKIRGNKLSKNKNNIPKNNTPNNTKVATNTNKDELGSDKYKNYKVDTTRLSLGGGKSGSIRKKDFGNFNT